MLTYWRSWFGCTRSPCRYRRFSTGVLMARKQVTYPAAYPGRYTIL